MLIRDMMQLYAMKRESTDLMLILADYKLDSRLDRDILNVKFLLDIGECIPYYNETTVLKFAIDNFFDINEINIKKLVDTIFAEYEMLRDHDMTTEEDIIDDRDTTETEGIQRDRTDGQDTTTVHSSTVNLDSTVTHNSTVNLDNSKTHDEDQTESINRILTENGTDTEENVVSAYNANTYQPRDKGTTTHAEQDTDTENNGRTVDYKENTEETETTAETTVTDEDTLTSESTTTDYDETEAETTRRNEAGTDDFIRDRDMREYGIKNGNTYQDLIEKERKVAMFNIYEWILKKLSNEICLQIW